MKKTRLTIRQFSVCLVSFMLVTSALSFCYLLHATHATHAAHAADAAMPADESTAQGYLIEPVGEVVQPMPGFDRRGENVEINEDRDV